MLEKLAAITLAALALASCDSNKSSVAITEACAPLPSHDALLTAIKARQPDADSIRFVGPGCNQRTVYWTYSAQGSELNSMSSLMHGDDGNWYTETGNSEGSAPTAVMQVQ